MALHKIRLTRRGWTYIAKVVWSERADGSKRFDDPLLGIWRREAETWIPKSALDAGDLSILSELHTMAISWTVRQQDIDRNRRALKVGNLTGDAPIIEMVTELAKRKAV